MISHLLATVAVALVLTGAAADTRARPNIVSTLVDDMGWADGGLRNDPGEMTDWALVANKSSQRLKLSDRLDAWLKDVGAQPPVPRDAAKPKQDQES